MIWVFLVHLLLLLPFSSQGANPGLVGRITQKGIDYAHQLGIEVLKSQIPKIQIPDMSGRYDIGGIGDVKYEVSRMHILEFQLPQSAVTFFPGTGIKLSISNAYIKINGDWRVKVLFISDSGSFDISVSGLSISAVIWVKKDDTGRPAVGSAGCSSSIGDLSIKFHGGTSWLYNLFTGALEGPIRNSLNEKLCPEVNNAINGLEPHLQTIPITAQIDKIAEIEYSLVNPPEITDKYTDLDFKGEFYNIGQHTEPPFSPLPIVLSDQTDSMLYVGISEFFANSAGFVYTRAGALQINITDDMIPEESPFRLNTHSFGVLVPEIEKLYPNMSMVMHLSASKQPVLTSQPDNLTVVVTGEIKMLVILPNASLAPLFILGLVSKLQTLVNLALKLVVLPQINEKLAKGFPLPTIDKIKFVSPSIKINQGFILIATDIQYTP
ncbi:bactericidal permeability-increasing protein-like isoform X2 [Protopterus annectens]|uniref:bactericidal permeability-increasing protein-like isoform X2 n=1 Tax=Protopterus annectens TaxID=7888 RepID=UPI001CF93374|nr:bactericidal permeability-increasing protein-like isoform X2 [Protopterus annectens]